MAGFEWEANRDGVFRILKTYFGVSEEFIARKLKENYTFSTNYMTESSRQTLVATVAALAPFCRQGKGALDPSLTKEEINDRKKSAEAILSAPKYTDDDASAIYNRLKSLYHSISYRGIDIYKTIYKTSLTDGNLGVTYDPDTRVVSSYSNYDRNFDRIYDQIILTLALSKENSSEIVNGMFEKCAATMLSKLTASGVSNIYQALLSFAIYNEEEGIWRYLYNVPDKPYIGLERNRQKVRAIRDGLVCCPSLFACNAEKLKDAYKYVMSKLPRALVVEEYNRAQKEGRVSMTMFECKRHLLRSWINNNFSVLTINARSMKEKEIFIKNLQAQLNNEFCAVEKQHTYNLSFLFENPSNICLMNSIPLKEMVSNAYKNIYLLEGYAGVNGTIEYIKKNTYVLAMDNEKLNQLLHAIDAHDKENPDNPYMGRFFKLGKSLFANKHNIDFDVIPVFRKLAKIEDIVILDVDKMDDWQRVEKFVELFFDNDPRIVPHIRKLHELKLKKDELGGREIRSQIRTILNQYGGWNEILTDRKKMLAVTTEIKSINNQRFIVEQIERTGDDYIDFGRLRDKEISFSEEIKEMLVKIKNNDVKREKLNKRFTDIDKLNDRVIDFLTNICFDDKEPITDIIESTLREPLIETLKDIGQTYVDPQQTLFGSEKVIVPTPEKLYSPLKKLTQELSNDAYHRLESDVIKITKVKDDGKK